MSKSTLPAAGECQFGQVQLNLAVRDTELGPSVCLAKFSGEDRKINLNQDALSLLKTIPQNKPVAVLSICGPYRSGKSFFLSRMLGTNDAFKVSSEMDPCTEGIWMSTIVLECNNFVVVLLDTEGTNAAQESEEFSATDVTKLLVLTTLLSSYLIYNTKGAPEKSHLDEMSCFSHIAETILLREGSSAADHLHDQNLQRFFPQFLWLLRDSDLKPIIEGNTVSLREYMRKRILVQSKQRSSNRDETVRTILALFPSLECRGIARPDKPLEKDLSFLSAIDAMAAQLLNDIQPKMSFEHEISINGSILASLIEQYVHALNEPGAVPNLELSWVQAVKHHLIEKCQLLVTEYCQEMKQKLQSGGLPIEEGDLNDLQTQQPSNTLARIHQEIFETKLAVIQTETTHTLPSNKEEGGELITIHFQRKIVHVQDRKVTEGELSHFVERNHKLSRQYCEQLLDKLCKEQEEIQLHKLQDDFFKSALGPAKEEVYQKGTKDIPGPPLKITIDSSTVGKAKVTWNQPDINPIAAKHYEVHVQEEPNKTWEQRNTAIKESQIEINVKPNTNHQIRIRGVNETRHGEFSEVVTFKTPPGKPDKPKKPHITIDSPTSAKFLIQRLPKEKENGSPVTHVIVESCTNNSEWQIVHTEKITLPSSQMTDDVSPYMFQVDLAKHQDSQSKEDSFLYLVRLKNVAGVSVPSDCVKVSTKKMHPGLVKFKESRIEARRVTVSWNYPEYYPSCVQHFYVRSKKGDGEFNDEIKCHEPVHDFNDLQPYTDYSFQVCGANETERGDWNAIKVKTKPDCPSPPSKPIVTIESHDKAKLTVKQLTKEEENGKKVDVVIVEQKKTSDLQWTKVAEKNLKTTRDRLTDESGIITFNLQLDSTTTSDTIQYHVVMKNEIGWSQPSEEFQVTISDLQPGPMEFDQSNTVRESTSITLKWKEPYNPASVKSYLFEKKVSASGWTTKSDSLALSCTDCSLQPNTKYTYRVTAIAISEKYNQISRELELCTDSDRPNQPTEKPTIDILSPTEATLHMPMPDDREANGSEIQTIIVENRYNNRKWEKCQEKKIAKDSQCEVKVCLPEKCTSPISYRVKFENDKGPSEPSPICDVRPDDLIPGPPSNLTHEVSSHSITLLWKQPLLHPHAVKYYNVQYKQVSDSTWIPNPPESCPGYAYTLSDLMPNKTYEYQICAVNKNGKSVEYLSAEANTDKHPPYKPEDVVIKVSSNNRATISVKKPDEQETGCQLESIHLYFYDEDMSLTEDMSIKTGAVNCHIDDRHVIIKNVAIEETTDFICISFINEKGEGPKSDDIDIKIQHLTPGEVSSLSVTEAKFDRLKLSWGKPIHMGRAAKTYEVMVKIDGSWKPIGNPQPFTEIEIPDLKPCTKYKVRVHAVNGDKKGEFSEIEENTIAGPPSKPRIEKVVIDDSDPKKALIRFHRLTEEEERGSKVDSVLLQWSFTTSPSDWENVTDKRKICDGENKIIEEEFEIPKKVLETTETQHKTIHYQIIMCSNLKSEPSEPYGVDLSDLCPGCVQNLKVLNTHPNSVELGWSIPQTNCKAVKNYIICCYEETQNSPGQLIQRLEAIARSESEISFEVRQLHSNRTYYFEVCARSDKCTGPTEKVVAKTSEIIFSKPHNLRADFRQRKAIKIRWSKPSQPESPAYYKVCVDSIGFTRLTRGMSTVIRNLKSSKTYIVRVTSMNENGNFDGNSTASATIETTMGNVKRGFAAVAAALPTLGSGGVAVLKSTEQADHKDVCETDEEYC